MLRARSLAACVALVCALSACNDRESVAPDATPPLPAEVTGPIQVALDDVNARLLPTLDPTLHAPLTTALVDLDAAMKSGRVDALELAVARTYSVLSTDPFDPDAAAVRLVLGRIDEVVKSHKELP